MQQELAEREEFLTKVGGKGGPHRLGHPSPPLFARVAQMRALGGRSKEEETILAEIKDRVAQLERLDREIAKL